MMIAGEWSVLQPGNHGVVTAINSRVKVTITRPTDKCWSIITSNGRCFSDRQPPSRWKITDPYWLFACTLLKVAARWYPLTIPYTINIETPPAANYGLGSSAAVSAALAAAVITAVSLQTAERDEILRLALVAHTESQGWRGSGSDCAAAVYGGTIVFRSFDIQYLKSAAKDRTSWNLLLLDISSSVLPLPKEPFRDMVPIWTGKKESTQKLLEHSEPFFGSQIWQTHIAEGESIALGMASIATAADAMEYLSLGRNWFYAFNDLAIGHIIVPEKMRAILDLLCNLGASAKPSGAGGGDCLVGILPPELKDTTIQKNILPLTSNAEGVLVKTEDWKT
jgi:phosphomevalonate kinase